MQTSLKHPQTTSKAAQQLTPTVSAAHVEARGVGSNGQDLDISIFGIHYQDTMPHPHKAKAKTHLYCGPARARRKRDGSYGTNLLLFKHISHISILTSSLPNRIKELDGTLDEQVCGGSLARYAGAVPWRKQWLEA